VLAANPQLLPQPFVFRGWLRDLQQLQPFIGSATPPPWETVIRNYRVCRRGDPLRVLGTRRIWARPHGTHTRHHGWSLVYITDTLRHLFLRLRRMMNEGLQHRYHQDRNRGALNGGGRDQSTGQKGKSYTTPLRPGVPSTLSTKTRKGDAKIMCNELATDKRT
jgi:hypothetical protein